MNHPLTKNLPVRLVAGLAVLLAGTAMAADNPKPEKRLHAADVFKTGQKILFQDDFHSGTLDRWNLSVNDQYDLRETDPGHVGVVAAPGLAEGKKAVRMTVQRAPNSFRSEISLPPESGFHERWYAERMLIPADWVFDSVPGNDIVMQWHAIPGNGKATFPNLDISIGNRNWFIKQSFGSAQDHPTRTTKKLDDPVQPGSWVSWVIHAKWSPGNDGLLQIWKDGKLVLEQSGTNVYSTIGIAYTPYLKTGIYHPEWHMDKDRKREVFEKTQPVATRKVIYITDVRVGDERAKLEDFLPQTKP